MQRSTSNHPARVVGTPPAFCRTATFMLTRLCLRMTLSAALSAPMFVEHAQAATDRLERQDAAQAVEKMSEQEVALRLAQARDYMDAKVSRLGLVAGPQFVDTVKKNSHLTRSFLQDPEQPVPFTGLLGEIVQKYAVPLSQAKRHHPSLYRETVKFFDDAIAIIETAPLSEVKERLARLQ